MKIKRLQLIVLVRNRISSIEALNESKKSAAADKRALRVKNYVTDTGEHWEEFARRILDAVIDDRPVTVDMIPHRLRGYHREGLRFWDPREPDPSEVPTRDLKTLLTFLEVAVDEEINTTALERQGFPLGKVLRGVS